MHSASVNQKPIKVDKFDFIQGILEAKISRTIADEDFEQLVAVYEKAIEKEINSNKYSPTMKITANEKKMLNMWI